ncbi:MAG TPA: HIT family protein [Methylomirabilota bacterium]|nr:HIT family protein [Methylomirabilota bacterium]
MTHSYDPQNIFARILRGEIPCHKVFEDDMTLAFMDVMPQAEGHTLVVPKTPARNMLDAAPDQLHAVVSTTQRIVRAVKVAFAADGVFVAQFNEPAAGQTVFHLHFHIIPRMDGSPLRPHTGAMADNAVLAGHAARIREALGG